MDNATLFVIGVVVSIPAIIVVVALVYAAGSDERDEERQHRDSGAVVSK